MDEILFSSTTADKLRFPESTCVSNYTMVIRHGSVKAVHTSPGTDDIRRDDGGHRFERR